MYSAIMTKTALIIGGGIAGPVTAMALQRAGIDSVVYEAYGRGSDGVPVQRMLRLTRDEIGARADALARHLHGSAWQVRVIDGASTVGGGSAPGTEIPTRLVELTRDGLSAEQIESHLRSLDPPLIARIVNDRVVLDLRTVAPGDDTLLLNLLQQAP